MISDFPSRPGVGKLQPEEFSDPQTLQMAQNSYHHQGPLSSLLFDPSNHRATGES